jgi:hypothetical protein
MFFFSSLASQGVAPCDVLVGLSIQPSLPPYVSQGSSASKPPPPEEEEEGLQGVFPTARASPPAKKKKKKKRGYRVCSSGYAATDTS